MQHPSKAATLTYAAYFEEKPDACYYLPFMKDLIYFLVDDFDIQVDLNSLPTNPKEETLQEKDIRTQVLDRLIDEFKQKFNDPFSKSDFCEEDEFEGHT